MKKYFLRSGIIFLLLICLSLIGCTSSSKPVALRSTLNLSQEERAWLQEFFRELLFENSGAYTLFGTKPISSYSIYRFSEEYKKEVEEYFKSNPREGSSNVFERITARNELCEKWNELKKHFNIRQYLFGSFPSPYADKNQQSEIILFVNIEESLRTLINYYEDFRRLLGDNFNPLEVVFEVENRGSKFWNAVMRNHVLLGILHGYGRDNAWFFEWSRQHQKDNDQKDIFLSSLPCRQSSFTSEKRVEKYTPKNFDLPPFKVYGLHPDLKLIEKYKDEKKKIMTLYRGRDEVEVVLDWLCR